MYLVLLGDPGDGKEGKQSFKVNIPPELDGRVLSNYYVNREGQWFKNGGDGKVIATSTTIIRAGG
jgi:hypothetical protein